MGSIKRDLIEAMKCSSLKGLPKIVNATNACQRAVWIIAVILFLSICILTVTTNIKVYFSYPKVITVEQKLMNQTDPNGTVPFPTIAVCNLNQFSSNKSMFDTYGIPTPGQYYEWIDDLLQCPGCDEFMLEAYDTGQRKLTTFRGYYQFVGRDAVQAVANEHFILDCQAMIASGTSLIMYPCMDFTHMYTFVHPDYGHCYAYEIIIAIEYWVVGLSFTLHLDSRGDNMNTAYRNLLFPAASSGALIMTYSPYIIPGTYGESTLASPGASTEIKLKIHRTDRLSRPYSTVDCLKETNKKFTFLGRQVDYDYNTCMGKCNIAYIEEQCNCTDFFIAQNPEETPPKYKYCMSADQPAGKIAQNMWCSYNTQGLSYMACSKECMEPCKEVRYTLTSAISKWPLPSQLASFYHNIIKRDERLMRKYGKYADIAEAVAYGFDNISDNDRFFFANSIEENFARVSVYLSDRYFLHYESKPKLSVDALVSQLGGSLNLWSGITVILVVEIIDLVIRITARISKEQNSTNVEALGIPGKAFEKHECAR